MAASLSKEPRRSCSPGTDFSPGFARYSMWNRAVEHYQIVDLEVEQALDTVTVPSDCTGLAFVLRRYGQPVGFFMESLPAGTALAPEELADRIVKHVGAQIISERLYAELSGPIDTNAFPRL